MNIPDKEGISVDQKNAEKQTAEEKFPAPVSCQKEGKAKAFQDGYFCMGFPDKGTDPAETGKLHVKLIGTVGRIQPPDQNMMKAAHIQKAFWGISLHADFDISFQVTDE